MVHQLVDLIQQEQPPLGILGPGDSGVDAAGDLIYIVANVVDLRPQLLDLLGGAGADGVPLNDPHEVGPLGEAAPLGLGCQGLVLRGGQFNVKMMLFYVSSPAFLWAFLRIAPS